MRSLLKIIMLVFAFSVANVAQAKIETGSDSWSGLKVGVTTPDEAIIVMGKPSKDAITQLDYEVYPHTAIASFLIGMAINIPDSWVATQRHEKVFRELIFDRSGLYNKIKLSFLENKLYLIDLTVSRKRNERLLAVDLGEIYKTNFVSVEGIPKDAKISDYEFQKEPTIPKAYSKFYGMLSITQSTILLAIINNDSFKKEFWTGKGEIKKQVFPGVIVKIQIMARNSKRNYSLPR